MMLATAPQVAAAAAHAVSRTILANQLVGSKNMGIVDSILDAATFYCLVDSVENLKMLEQFFSARNRQLNVLIEIGTEYGRAGCRSLDQGFGVAAVISKSDSLNLAGIEVYEG